MSCCNHCTDADTVFNDKTARWDRWRYRTVGPRKSTRLLVDAIRSAGVAGKSLLDIGGGVGLIRSELIRDGLDHAVQADASAGFLKVSEEEAAREGFSRQAEFHYGDFVELASGLQPADIVTLDRVICCYPDMPRLVGSSLDKTEEIIGLVYPRNRRFGRMVFGLVNLWFRFTGSGFRMYLYRPEDVDSLVLEQGFRQYYSGDTIFWHVAVYRKAVENVSE